MAIANGVVAVVEVQAVTTEAEKSSPAESAASSTKRVSVDVLGPYLEGAASDAHRREGWRRHSQAYPAAVEQRRLENTFFFDPLTAK